MTLMVHELWLGRHEVPYQHKKDKDQEIYSMESAELCHYHSNPNLIQTSEQHYCHNTTVNKLLQSQTLVVYPRWLKWVKTAPAPYLRINRQLTNAWYPFSRQGMSPLHKRWGIILTWYFQDLISQAMCIMDGHVIQYLFQEVEQSFSAKLHLLRYVQDNILLWILDILICFGMTPNLRFHLQADV